MKEKIKQYIKEIITFFVLVSIFANILSYYKSSDLNNQPLSIDYSFKQNEPILIHIWATWCPTCKLEASNIQTIANNYEVLSIVVKSGSTKEIRDYMGKNNLNFKFINDNDGYFAQKFNISAYPTTFIYNKDKKLVFSEVGYTSTFGLWLRMWWAGL